MHRWKFSALAAATLASVALYTPSALALALGTVTVQSAIGEPLRAEIELPSITPAEAESLKVGTAPAETFRAQGMEYSGAVAQIQVALQKRPGGQSYLRVSSSRPVNEPFVDLIIDATWATGRITRSYTMLFDPPAMRRPEAVAAAPQISKPERATAPARATASPTSRPVVPAAEPRTRSAGSVATTAESVTVKTGDTAGRIANANRPQGVSLDQMLIALLRANPSAFIDGNVNLVKAGAVLQMPDAEQAGATSAAEARKTIAAQSRDFNNYRRQLAAAAPAAQASSEPASRSASGKVQTEVQEDASASTSPDKLTLSKGAVKGTQATPEALAKRKESSEALARVEALAKNISELNKLTDSSTMTAPPGTSVPADGVSAAASVTTPAAAAAAPGIVVAGDSPVTALPAATPNAEPSASSTVAAADTTATSPAAPATSNAAPADAAAPAAAPAEATPPVAAPVTPPVVASVTPAAEPSMVDSMLEDPLVPGLILALLLALGYGGYRYAQSRRNADGLDSSFLESRLQPDSFFGSSGGQQVDTSGNSTGSTGSSLAFSHSQLDAGGDVDPLAEADVYLAYGRDLQAEEILKEAVRQTPDRLSVHTKLADIYAKRKDQKALEAQATEIFRLTDGQGPEWNRVCELGRELDPQNRYYQPGGQTQALPELTAPSGFASTNFPAPDHGLEDPPSLPVDLDIDLDLPDNTLRTTLSTSPAAAEPTSAGSTGGLAAAALASAIADVGAASTARGSLPDFHSSAAPSPQQAPVWAPPSASVSTASAERARDHFDTARDKLEFTAPPDTQPAALTAEPEEKFTPSKSGLMEFDIGNISLDLDSDTERGSLSPSIATTDIDTLQDGPFATKLALAREFAAIGDNDGARTLLEEVVAESSGDLKVQARSLLAALN